MPKIMNIFTFEPSAGISWKKTSGKQLDSHQKTLMLRRFSLIESALGCFGDIVATIEMVCGQRRCA